MTRASSSAGLLPILVRCALLALAVQPQQVFPRRRLNTRGPGQVTQKIVIALARVAAYDRPHRRVGFERRRIDGDPLTLHESAIDQYAQYPAEHFPMRVQIDQPPRARNRRVIQRVLVQTNPHKRRNASESANRQAMPRSAPMPSKYPIKSARK